MNNAIDGRAKLGRRAALLGGAYRLTGRAMLECGPAGGERDLALNDVLIKAQENSRLVRLEVEADGELVTEYTCDGLILCTPTGSTAYRAARSCIDCEACAAPCASTLCGN
mgnify:CR=1 FL=1